MMAVDCMSVVGGTTPVLRLVRYKLLADSVVVVWLSCE